MKKIKYIIKIIIFKVLGEKKVIGNRYYRRTNKKINFKDEPKTFNEKLQFRKLYDNNPLYTICSDKYKVRDYVANKIGEKYLIPMVMFKDKIKIEDLQKLKGRFVIKANHNSGPVQFFNSRENSHKEIKEICKEINSQLKYDYGKVTIEKWYSNIDRGVLIEKMLIDNKNQSPKDYKFHYFKKTDDMFIMVDSNRFINHTRKIYDIDWKDTNMSLVLKKGDIQDEKPENFEEMKGIVRKLGEEFEYVRVDLYNLAGKIYFGELTFAESSGFGKFSNDKFDKLWGELW